MMWTNQGDQEPVKIKILEGHRQYKTVLRECKYLVNKGVDEKDRTLQRKYYAVAYQALCRFETAHPMYIRKMSRMRETIENKLR